MNLCGVPDQPAIPPESKRSCDKAGNKLWASPIILSSSHTNIQCIVSTIHQHFMYALFSALDRHLFPGPKTPNFFPFLPKSTSNKQCIYPELVPLVKHPPLLYNCILDTFCKGAHISHSIPWANSNSNMPMCPTYNIFFLIENFGLHYLSFLVFTSNHLYF